MKLLKNKEEIAQGDIVYVYDEIMKDLKVDEDTFNEMLDTGKIKSFPNHKVDEEVILEYEGNVYELIPESGIDY